jgi:hypothetical protein
MIFCVLLLIFGIWTDRITYKDLAKSATAYRRAKGVCSGSGKGVIHDYSCVRVTAYSIQFCATQQEQKLILPFGLGDHPVWVIR